MSPSRLLRSVTIVLVVELATFSSGVSAFTISRNDNPTDLVAEESANLRVENDLTSNNVKVIDLKHDVTSHKLPIETTAKTEEIQKNNANTEDIQLSTDNISNTEKDVGETTSGSISTKISDLNNDVTTQKLLIESKVKTEEIQKSQSKIGEVEPANDNTSSTVEETSETTTMESSSVMTSDTIPLSTDEVEESTSEGGVHITSTSTNSLNYINKSNITNDTYFVDDNISLSTENGALNKVSPNLPSTRTETTTFNLNSSPDVTINTDPSMETDKSSSYSTEPLQADESTSIAVWTSEDADLKTISIDQRSHPTSYSERISPIMEINDMTTITSKSEGSTEFKKYTDTSTANAFSSTDSGTDIPYWKKYTTIERKRSSTEEISEIPTRKGEDMVRLETGQTTVNFQKAFDVPSDIPSLENLKNELLALNMKLSTAVPEIQSSPLTVTTVIPLISESDGTSTTEPRTTKIDVVLTKRAGFLDYSSRPTTTEREITIIKNETTTNAPIETEKIEIVRENQVTREDEKKNGGASQSQLTDEDAINEELMKEEILIDNVENAKRFREERFNTDAIKTNPAQVNQETSSEEKLSVKPINEKMNIYAVNPNYKPLKKIEVQPPKPFVRNPDDNSWRNESLSSLGIVFKAKNSTKPFTQVLKNKTETEWNALFDKYNKGDEPELRARLEKIAERRKSKKKKTNKSGETYSDYEESSSAETTSADPQQETPSPDIIPLSEISLPIATEPSPTKQSVATSDRTKQKMKKYNLENYDDDDDSDYVSPPIIDLQKFVTSPKTSPIPTTVPVLYTKPPPMRHFLPDRQPTVQYFPPRDNPKVAMTNEDAVFKPKVNAYSFKDSSKSIPTEPVYPSQNAKAAQPQQFRPDASRPLTPLDLNKNIYISSPLELMEHDNGDVSQEKSAYVMKHLKEFMDEVMKTDHGRGGGYATESPARIVAADLNQNKVKPPNDYYDYEAQFRKDVLDKFIENFNQNSERFKVDFPILYNTSVVHNDQLDNGKVQASSTAFIKRLYEEARAFKPQVQQGKYDPNCDRTVELSPAYELHYYVPEEEEKEQVEPKVTPLPYRFRI